MKNRGRDLVNAVRKRMNDRDFGEVMRATGATFFLRALSFFLISGFHFLVASVCGASNLGIFNLAFTVINLLLIVSLLGTDTSTIRLMTEYRSRDQSETANRIFHKVMAITLVLSVFCSIGLLASSNWIAIGLFHESALVQPLQLFAVILPCLVLTRLFASAYRALKRASESLWFEVLAIRAGSIVLFLFLNLFLAGHDFHAVYAFAGATIISAVWGALHWSNNIRRNERSSGLQNDQAGMTVKEILTLSVPMFLVSSMEVFMNWTDTIMLGIFTTPEEVGIYNVLLKFSYLTTFAYVSMNTIILPKFSELYWSHDTRGLQRIIHFSNQLLFWTYLPVLLFIFLFAKPILSWFGESYQAGVPALILLCAGHFSSCLTGNVIALLNATGQQKKSRDTLIVSTLCNILLNYLLIPQWGMLGAAFSTAVSIVLRDILASYFAYRTLGMRTWYIPGWPGRREASGYP